MQAAIREAITELLSKRGLYQKVSIQTTAVNQHIAKVALAHQADDYRNEFQTRIWEPFVAQASGPAPRSSLTASDEYEFPVRFIVPNFPSNCSLCDKETLFVAANWAKGDFPMEVFPQMTPNSTRQIFLLFYQCGECHRSNCAVLILREGLKLTICGRSERFVPPVNKVIPKTFRPIVVDALNATNEADIFGGFYHLRTFLEHYMKAELKNQPSDKIEGEELCENYATTLDTRMKDGLPSLLPIYRELSQMLHARSGTREDFDRLLETVYDHFDVKEIFSKYAKQQERAVSSAPPVVDRNPAN
ncbi:MAG TPA: hypothetical protein VFT34_00515 [Verrucomicrobiae bacterium]|nr:hypothetical protein [Verrucomicrobiae bacterium]